MDVENPRSSMKGSDDDKQVEGTATVTQISAANLSHLVSEKLTGWGVESRGIQPVGVEDRTETQFIKIFFVWFSSSTSFVAFAAGTLGPTTFKLSLGEACLCIFFLNMIFAIYPAYFATWGPKLGLRQLCASRYAFGYYGACVPSLLSVIYSFGFCILSSIMGGQALASISDVGGTMAIMAIAGISLFISFCGLKFVNWYLNYAWIPVLLVFVIATGVGGKHFVEVPVPPGTLAQISNFGAILAGHMLPLAALSSDYTAYFHPRVSSWRVFAYSYLGLTIPTITLQCSGAAAAASASVVPDWEAEFAHHQVGGLLSAMLSPVGGFGKFLMILVSLSVAAANIPRIYSMSFAFQTFIPTLVAFPRYVFPVFAIALITMLSVAGQHKFSTNLSDFLGIIGYWAGPYVCVFLVEHLLFRKHKFARYDVPSWDVPSQLPLGAAALGASVVGFGLAIPTISQPWYTGPVAVKFGDTSFVVSMLVTAIFYTPLRRLEICWKGV